ncbi:MAG TPA: tetratricopeptide repeat protein, partial [Rhodothermia bacterium]
MSMFDFEFDEQDDSIERLRLDGVVEAYERSLNDESDSYFDSETLEDIATYYFETEAFAEALEVIDRLLLVQPFSSDVWLKRGVLLNTLERHEEAVEAYER